MSNRIYHSRVTVRSLLGLLEFNKLHSLGQSGWKPVVFRDLEFSPFFHGEKSSNFASAAYNNVIKRTKYGIFEGVTKRVNVNGQKHPDSFLNGPRFQRVSEREILKLLFSRSGGDVDSFLIAGDIIEAQFNGPVCANGNVQLKDEISLMKAELLTIISREGKSLIALQLENKTFDVFVIKVFH